MVGFGFSRFSAAPAEPTLPRLTRLGAPTTPIDAIPPPPLLRFDNERPPLPALDTQMPPLPLPQPGFARKNGAPISPSVYSSASSSDFSRRRSSAGSEDGRPASSRSSASGHESFAPFKHVPWGAAPQPSMLRKDSASSDYSISPKNVSPYGQQQPPRPYGAAPPRVPVGARQAPSRPQSPYSVQNPYAQNPYPRPEPPRGLSPNPNHRSFLRSPTPEAGHRSESPELQPTQFRSARSESPRPPQQPIQRSASPLARLREEAPAPLPLRTARTTNMSISSIGGPGPVFSGPHAGHTSSIYSVRQLAPPTPPPGRNTPPLRSFTPSLPPSPPSRPMSMKDVPVTEMEINTLWSHACLLYHNGKPGEAVQTLHALHQRPGAEALTLARCNINVGLISESLSENRNAAGVSPQQATQLMIEAFQAAVKQSPDGPEGALATFLLGCALFDNEDFDKAASCFDMCEAVFAGENENANFRMSANEPWSAGGNRRPSELEGGENINLNKIGMNYTLHLSIVRENYHVAQERSRIPAYLGTNRGIHRLPSGLLIEDPLPPLTPQLSPLAESEEDEAEADRLMADLHGALRPSGIELPEMRLDFGGQMDHQPPQGAPLMRRRTTKKQDREEMERRREARRTRILIKLGDLRLNKPLPPLPHEREAMKRAQTPPVPPLPVAKVMGGMAFV